LRQAGARRARAANLLRASAPKPAMMIAHIGLASIELALQ